MAYNLITGRTARLPGDYKPQAIANKANDSGPELAFIRLWTTLECSACLPVPVREHRFHINQLTGRATRKWRFDFAWPEHMLAVEIEGMASGGGRHQRRVGYSRDCEKYRQAAILGWTVLRYTSDEMHKRPLDIIEEVASELKSRIEHGSKTK